MVRGGGNLIVRVGVWDKEREISCSAVSGRDKKRERSGDNSGIVCNLLVST